MVSRDTLALVGQRLVDARQTVGASQQAVADASHVSRTTIRNIERGRKRPHSSTLMLIFAGLSRLGVDLAAFYEESA